MNGLFPHGLIFISEQLNMASSLNKVHNKDFVLQLFESPGILVTADSE